MNFKQIDHTLILNQKHKYTTLCKKIFSQKVANLPGSVVVRIGRILMPCQGLDILHNMQNCAWY